MWFIGHVSFALWVLVPSRQRHDKKYHTVLTSGLCSGSPIQYSKGRWKFSLHLNEPKIPSQLLTSMYHTMLQFGYVKLMLEWVDDDWKFLTQKFSAYQTQIYVIWISVKISSLWWPIKRDKSVLFTCGNLQTADHWRDGSANKIQSQYFGLHWDRT